MKKLLLFMFAVCMTVSCFTACSSAITTDDSTTTLTQSVTTAEPIATTAAVTTVDVTTSTAPYTTAPSTTVNTSTSTTLPPITAEPPVWTTVPTVTQEPPTTATTTDRPSSGSDSSESATTTEAIPDGPSQEAPQEFLIYSIEMKGRYGDATLIKYGDYEILVDGGTSSDAASVKAALDKWVEDDCLDLLIISHPDADHIDGIEKYSTFSSIESIGMVVQNGDDRGNADFERNVLPRFPSAVKKTVAEIMQDDSLTSIAVDELFSITFLDQKNYYDSSASKNDRSIAFIIEYKNTVLFMGGDMETSACGSVMAMNPNLTTDEQFVIFKALHHGSNGTNKAGFLSYLKPDLAFVSAGMYLESDNTPNLNTHPYPEALSRIAKHTTDIYWSSLSGNLSIVCDGYDATVTGEGRTRDYYYKTPSASGLFKADRMAEASITVFKSRYYIVAIEYKGFTDFAGVLK